MKIEINNLTALVQGRDLNLYQRSLAVEEWHKLLNYVDEMEQTLRLGAVVGQSEQLKIEKYNEPLTGKNGTYVSDKVGDYIDNF